MALPRTVRVKLSSEAAEACPSPGRGTGASDTGTARTHSRSDRQRRGAPPRDPAARHSGERRSRFRWAGWAADAESASREELAAFPTRIPPRPLTPALCPCDSARRPQPASKSRRDEDRHVSPFSGDDFLGPPYGGGGCGRPNYVGYSYRDRAPLPQKTKLRGDRRGCAPGGRRPLTARCAARDSRTCGFDRAELLATR